VAEKNQIIEQYNLDKQISTNYFENIESDLLKVVLLNPDMSQVMSQHLEILKEKFENKIK
jgi:hypothetical protein